jgi:hypothetical protein
LIFHCIRKRENKEAKQYLGLGAYQGCDFNG